jgi:hypothetical protein
MKAQREIASFVVRFTHDLWQDQQGEPRVAWRGQVRRVQDGEELRFTDLAEAMSFIKASLLKVTMDCIPKEDKVYQEKAMQESFKLWEKFAQNYTSMIVEAMQQTAKQSEALQKQMGEAMEQAWRPWWLPAPPPAETSSATSAIEQAELLQTLSALQSQLATLNDKVAQLEAQLQNSRKA